MRYNEGNNTRKSDLNKLRRKVVIKMDREYIIIPTSARDIQESHKAEKRKEDECIYLYCIRGGDFLKSTTVLQSANVPFERKH